MAHLNIITLRRLLLCFSASHLLSIASSVLAYEKANERWYQAVWCHGNGGQSEVLLENNRRVDCLTKEHAIEMEFANKWHHAIGQTLDYAMLTGKHAGIVLILRNPKDHHYWQQLNTTINHYQLPITLWKLGP